MVGADVGVGVVVAPDELVQVLVCECLRPG